MLVFVAFALKLVIVAALARAVRPRCPDALGAALAGWVIATALIFAIFFALSLAGSLSRLVFWTALFAGAAAAAFSLRRHSALPPLPRDGRLVLALFALFWLAFALRTLVFPDFSRDAQSIGLVRIGFWLNRATVFHAEPTPFVSLFTAEWNFELLALHYALATGDLQGAIFANAETLLVSCAAGAWLARLVGASWRWAYAAAGLAILCPACLGMLTAVKGDVLAVGAITMAAGWALLLQRRPSGFAAIMLTAAACIAAGAKVTAFPAAAAVGLFGLAVAARHFFTRRTLPLVLAMAAVFFARFLVNAAEYGNPIQRLPGEAPEPSLSTFLFNLALIGRRFLEFVAHDAGGPRLAEIFMGGLGLTGFVFAAAAALAVLGRRRPPLAVLAALSIGLLASCFAVPPYAFGFRYLMPALLVIGLILTSVAEPWRAAPRLSWIPLAAVVLAIAANISYLAWPGEVNGNGTLARALGALPAKGAVERTFLADWERGTYSRFAELRLDRPDPLRFVVYQIPNGPILAYVGSKGQHRIALTMTHADLPPRVERERPDFVIVQKHGLAVLAPALRQRITAAGYAWIDDNARTEIAARADLPEARQTLRSLVTAPVLRGGSYALERWSAIRFRWMQARSEIEVPLKGGAACVRLFAFGTGRDDPRQIIRIEGVEAEPAAFDVAGTDIGRRRDVRIQLKGPGATARLHLVATMPAVVFPNDVRPIAWGVVDPPDLLPADSCAPR